MPSVEEASTHRAAARLVPRPARDRRRGLGLPLRERREHPRAPTSTRPTPRAARSSCAWSSASSGCSSAATSWSARSPSASREPLDMDWRFAYADRRKRTALLASRDDHCLLDLLWRWRRGELDDRHRLRDLEPSDHAADVAGFGVPYHHVPVSADAKAEAEAQMLELLARRRPRRARALHADPLARLPRPARRAGDQHPPLVPAGVRRRRSVPPRARARRQDHRRDGALRHRGARRRADHRAGRRARLAPPERRGARADRPRHRARRARARGRRGTSQDRVLVHENRTVVF